MESFHRGTQLKEVTKNVMQLFVFVISWVSGICLMGSGLLVAWASHTVTATSFTGPVLGGLLAIIGFVLVMLGINAYEQWQAKRKLRDLRSWGGRS